MKQVAFALSLPHRTIAFATLIALLAWTMGLPAWIHSAEAANVSDFSDTLSSSDLGVDSLHTIFFTTSNAMTAGQSFRIYFYDSAQNPDFDFTGLADADVTGTSTGFTAVTACDAAGDEIDLSVNTTSDYIEGTVCAGDTVPAGLIGLRVGLPAGAQVNNPATADSYIISLQGNGATPISDEGDTRVAIIDDVTVTASVDTVFQFSINGVNTGATVNNDVTTVSGTSTATTVPFGTLAPGTPKLMAQRLTVDTNAANGFSVTVQADQTLEAGNGATIDEFVNGSRVASGTAWAAPAGTLGATTTYGHWGLTSDDDAVSGASTTQWGVGTTYYRGDFTNNPVEVFYHNSPVLNTSGVGVGSTTVAYKVQIMALQEAATDYTAQLMYIATPVF